MANPTTTIAQAPPGNALKYVLLAIKNGSTPQKVTAVYQNVTARRMQ
jgi:hypothetical protein